MYTTPSWLWPDSRREWREVYTTLQSSATRDSSWNAYVLLRTAAVSSMDADSDICSSFGPFPLNLIVAFALSFLRFPFPPYRTGKKHCLKAVKSIASSITTSSVARKMYSRFLISQIFLILTKYIKNSNILLHLVPRRRPPETNLSNLS
jgi:hypothetical protein